MLPFGSSSSSAGHFLPHRSKKRVSKTYLTIYAAFAFSLHIVPSLHQSR